MVRGWKKVERMRKGKGKEKKWKDRKEALQISSLSSHPPSRCESQWS